MISKITTPEYGASIVQVGTTKFFIVRFFGEDNPQKRNDIDKAGFRIASGTEFARFRKDYGWVLQLFPFVQDREVNRTKDDVAFLIFKK